MGSVFIPIKMIIGNKDRIGLIHVTGPFLYAIKSDDVLSVASYYNFFSRFKSYSLKF